ncbi:amphi-Trp domain-containing protein [Halorarius litoreus]|uniref:amphi-Trp domain-containing protein n=1 Tax=Halorarius litoreus TaxID=2962676 RepID=UPI0020CB875E|nr:amphi-Trp domain-containing protein [Halorarius litoreus]
MNEFTLEQETRRTEIADYLHQLADGLESGDKVTLIVGDQSVTIDPPEHVFFKIETDTDSSWLGGENGQSIEFELGWEAADVDTDEELLIVQQPNEESTATTQQEEEYPQH